MIMNPILFHRGPKFIYQINTYIFTHMFLFDLLQQSQKNLPEMGEVPWSFLLAIFVDPHPERLIRLR